eukprot:scaffold268_cov236-Pinguiococcus_pyrenoidosus.AAC.24
MWVSAREGRQVRPLRCRRPLREWSTRNFRVGVLRSRVDMIGTAHVEGNDVLSSHSGFTHGALVVVGVQPLSKAVGRKRQSGLLGSPDPPRRQRRTR